MSTVTMIGTLVAPAELRYSPSGTAVTKFRIAENYGKGEDKKSTFISVVCFSELAENVSESLTDKGLRVIVAGRLSQNDWETKEGEKRSSIEIVADEVGAALRFATAEISRTERQGPGRE